MRQMDDKYTDSDKYQKEIADQYKKRVSKFSTGDVLKALKLLGVKGVDTSSLIEAEAGNMSATYLTPTLAIKINNNRESPDYLANKIIFDELGSKCPIVKVLEYDFFEKTEYEVLIMERTKGTLLQDDIFELDTSAQEKIFREVLGVVKKMLLIKFEDFGDINTEKTYPTYSEYLKNNFAENLRIIREKQLCEEKDIEKVEKYFLDNVDVFSNVDSVFVHSDIHMGNILHDGDTLTALIDFDYSLKAPAVSVLISLLGFVDNPSQFVEGTKDFPKYKGKDFYHLLPILKEELHEIFSDPLLLKKLNIIGIRNGVDLISDNWSEDFNKLMIRNIVEKELAENDSDLKDSYYGKVLS